MAELFQGIIEKENSSGNMQICIREGNIFILSNIKEMAKKEIVPSVRIF